MKLMKCLLPLCLLGALLAGCGSSDSAPSSAPAASSAVVDSTAPADSAPAADEPNTAALDAAVAAIEQVNPVANPRAIDDFSLENEMGVTMDNIVAFKGDVTNDQADCALVFVAQVKDGTADAVVGELSAYQAALAGNDLYVEFADKVAKAQDARIMAQSNYVAMVIAGVNGPDYSEIDTVLQSALGGL